MACMRLPKLMTVEPTDTTPQPPAIPLGSRGIKAGIKFPSHRDDETVCVEQTGPSSPAECSHAQSGVSSTGLLQAVYCPRLLGAQLSQLSTALAALSTQRTQ